MRHSSLSNLGKPSAKRAPSVGRSATNSLQPNATGKFTKKSNTTVTTSIQTKASKSGKEVSTKQRRKTVFVSLDTPILSNQSTPVRDRFNQQILSETEVEDYCAVKAANVMSETSWNVDAEREFQLSI
jgi:hypothetical protein